MLEPGAWLTVDASGNFKTGKHFSFPVDCSPDLSGREAYEEIDSAIERAVQRHLISDVPVGTFLSGGIDSPLVAAKIRQNAIMPIDAFTIGVANDPLDESADAIQYAKELGVKHQLKYFTPNMAYQMLPQVVQACSEPFADYSIFPTMLVSELAHERVKVVLSGDGGDELFWGYAGRFASVLKIAPQFQQPYWLRSSRWWLRKYLGFGEGEAQLRYRDIGSWYRAKHTRLPEEWSRVIFPDLPDWPVSYKAFDYNDSDPDTTASWLRWNEFVCHLTMVLLKVDRASMYHSLEVRVPLLDRELVELAMRIGWRSCLDIQTTTGKIPLRHILSRSTQFQTHAKRGFSVPMADWLREPLQPLVERLLLDANEILGLPLNQKKMRELYQLHLSRRADYGWGLWLLLSLSLWSSKHYRLLEIPYPNSPPIKNALG
jgi:asparagine synthase (glutamine-hydrolysing)